LSRIAEFAAQLCEAPQAMVTLVEEDRQTFLARHNSDLTCTPRDTSICAHAMLRDEVLVVPDTTQDSRFADFSLVTGSAGLRFYAGAPLRNADGVPLGALCVLSDTPRPEGLNALQENGLRVLADAALRRLDERRHRLQARRELEASEARYRTLVDSIPDIAFTTDADGRFDYYNRRFFEYTGLDPESFTHDDVLACLHESERDDFDNRWNQARKDSSDFVFEHRMKHADGDYRWLLVRAVPLSSADGGTVRWFGTMTDIDDAHRLAQANTLLANELSHRIKNIFAVVAGLIAMTARSKPELGEFADELNGKIRALGRAHDYVRPDSGHHGNSLKELLSDLSEPYRHREDGGVGIEGEDVAIKPASATPLALIFHELATNAAKYGAFSVPEGSVRLLIEEEEDRILLSWIEEGGPRPEPDEIEGFGSRLLKMSVEHQLCGTLHREWHDEGLCVELSFPRSALSG
jgi:PAS domain S-box-containing protein